MDEHNPQLNTEPSVQWHHSLAVKQPVDHLAMQVPT